MNCKDEEGGTDAVRADRGSGCGNEMGQSDEKPNDNRGRGGADEVDPVPLEGRFAVQLG